MSKAEDRKDLLALVAMLYRYATATKTDRGEPGEIPWLAERLQRTARSLHRCAEVQCGDLEGPSGASDAAWKRFERYRDERMRRYEKRDASLTDRAREIVTRLRWVTGADIRLQFNGDPRGCAVKLVMPNGENNGWDRTWGV